MDLQQSHTLPENFYPPLVESVPIPQYEFKSVRFEQFE
jgi:hypothetical protein